MGNDYYVGIDLTNADCECLKDVLGGTYVDGEGEIEIAENGDYQYIMTFTVERAYDMTNWEDENQNLNDNEDLDTYKYPKPFAEAVFYGTSYQ